RLRRHECRSCLGAARNASVVLAFRPAVSAAGISPDPACPFLPPSSAFQPWLAATAIVQRPLASPLPLALPPAPLHPGLLGARLQTPSVPRTRDDVRCDVA